jgi:hypothetical protein
MTQEYEHLNKTGCTPKLIPAVVEDVFSSTCYVEEIVLTNVTDADVTVTMADKQTTPVPLLSAVPIYARSVVSLPFKARYCPSGLTWVCSAADSVVGYVRGRN